MANDTLLGDAFSDFHGGFEGAKPPFSRSRMNSCSQVIERWTSGANEAFLSPGANPRH